MSVNPAAERVEETAKDAQKAVVDFWEEAACGEVYATGDSPADRFEAHARARYRLEPYIHEFARFEEGAGRTVVEIGVGMGADHVEWARSGPAKLLGADITRRAAAFTRDRLATYGFPARVLVGDAERFPLPDDSVDIVYSWGVLHHSPGTDRAIREVLRILRPGGTARIMVYHKHSVTGYLLWLRYALLAGKPGRSLDEIYHHHLESPGTKAYTVQEAGRLFDGFAHVDIRTALAFGDLLEGEVGQRHRGPLLTLAKRIWPRWLIRRLFRSHGLLLLVEARK